MSRVTKFLLGPATAALLLALVVAPSAMAASPSAANCVRANDIEAIVDDSISMEFSDPDRLRVQAMNLLIDSLDAKTQLGAIEFGSEGFETPAAETLFPPEPIGPNAVAMKAPSTSGSKPTTAPPTTTPPLPRRMPTTPTPTRASSSPTAVTSWAPTTKRTSATKCRPT